MTYVTPEMELVELKVTEIATLETSKEVGEEGSPEIPGGGTWN